MSFPVEPPQAAAYCRYKRLCSAKGEDTLDATSKEDLKRVEEMLWDHFNEEKTPVMIDDTIKAYILVGMSLSSSCIYTPRL